MCRQLNNMKKILFGFLLLCSAFVQAEKTRDIQWIKIANWDDIETTVYVDVKSVKHEKDNGGIWGSGIIAYQWYKPTKIDFGQGEKETTALTRYYLVECKTNRYVTMVDFYFNVPRLPGVIDKPLGGVEYTSKNQDPLPISPTSPIYKSLCAEFI